MNRDYAEQLLVSDDIKNGLGSASQIAAWREMEWRRCASDPVYFFDNYAWLMLKDDTVARWRLWPIQRLILGDWHNGRSMVAIKARQLGITTLEVNYFLWKSVFSEAAKTFLVADSEPKAIEALTKLRVTLDRLPTWMRERAAHGDKQLKNVKADTKDGAKTVGFGFSEIKVLTSTPNSVAGVSGTVGLDEFGRHRDQKRVLDNAIPAFDGGGQMFIIGNGNGEDELFTVFNRARDGKMKGMDAYFFWWGDDPDRLYGSSIEGVPVDSVRVDGRKILYLLADGSELTRDEFMRVAADGKLSAPWYDSMKEMYLREDDSRDIFSFRAQYPTTLDEAVYMGGDSFFDLRVINGYQRMLHDGAHPKHMVGSVEVDYVERDENGLDKLKWHSRHSGHARLFVKPEEGGLYVAGCDPTMGRDDLAVIDVERIWMGDQALEVLEKYGHLSPPIVEGEPAFKFEPTDFILEQVLTYEGKTEPLKLAGVAENICRFYNDAFLVIESNPGGGGAALIETIKPLYWNLYRETRTETFADRETEQIGYWESGSSRKKLLDLLNGWLGRGWLIVNDPAFIGQASRFGYNEQGKLTAPKGLHDDLIFGKGLAIMGARNFITERSAGEDINFGVDW